jgi:monoamine oxidase
VLALKEEWQRAEEPQYRVQGGYTALMQALYDECHARTCSFKFSAQVKTITWAFEKVAATTRNGSTYTAPAVIITIPAALLQKDSAASISFQPEPTDHLQAFQDLGSGDVDAAPAAILPAGGLVRRPTCQPAKGENRRSTFSKGHAVAGALL